jgi:hypothetical protein
MKNTLTPVQWLKIQVKNCKSPKNLMSNIDGFLEEALLKEKNKSRFNIDFFELAFLTEVCTPPSAIARHTFFLSVIDVHYHKMNLEERSHFYDWIGKMLDMEHDESKIFMARFNPDNQYVVDTNCLGEEKQVEAFLLNGKYMISSTIRIDERYIVSVKKISV